MEKKELGSDPIRNKSIFPAGCITGKNIISFIL